MIFTIVRRNQNTGAFIVSDETGNQVQVSDSQIVTTMLKGYAYTNAKPTNKGFSYTDGTKTHFAQVDSLPSAMKKQLKELASSVAALEQQKKQMQQLELQKAQLQEQQRQLQQKPRAFVRPKAIARPKVDASRIPSNANQESYIYRGQAFSSEKKMCDYYHRDYALYKQLRSQGQSIGASLGQTPLSASQDDKKARALDRALDSMELRRHEYQ
jgi:small-conductance mechanosensitive channel